MKVKVLQIVWHNKEPVFSLDFDSSGSLATAGADSEIKLWKLGESKDGDIEATFLDSITGDKCESGFKTWNCVRFCPRGQSLAAAGDLGQIYVWKPTGLSSKGGSNWRGTNCGAYSGEDVVDLCWSSDGSGFVTASNDMTCMFWEPEATGGKARLRLEGHRLYVQGVAWDPFNQHIVSQGADRSCRVYTMRQAVPGTKKKAASKQAIHRLDGLYCSHVINKSISVPQADNDVGSTQKPTLQKGAQHLFHDESLSTFFRRLAWSPDGSMLVVPAGTQKSGAVNASINVAYVFARGSWTSPLMQLPVAPKPAIAVRFCPLLFELEKTQTDTPGWPTDLPYRMIFAIATRDSILIFDTQSVTPLVVLGGLHLEVITDLAWSPDGHTLAISSYDCYCSVAKFEEGELGTPIDLDKVPAHIQSVLSLTETQRSHGAAEKRYTPENPAGAMPADRPKSADKRTLRSQEKDALQPTADILAKPGMTQIADARMNCVPDAPAASPLTAETGIGAKKARRIVPTMLTTNAPAASVPQQSTSKELQASSLEKGLKHGGQTPEVGPLVESAEQEMKGYGLSIAQMAAAAGKSAAVKQS